MDQQQDIAERLSASGNHAISRGDERMNDPLNGDESGLEPSLADLALKLRTAGLDVVVDAGSGSIHVGNGMPPQHRPIRPAPSQRRDESPLDPGMITLVLKLCEAGMRVEVDPFTRRICVEKARGRGASSPPLRPRIQPKRTSSIPKLGCP